MASMDGQTLLLGSSGGTTVKLWDLPSKQCMNTMDRHTGTVSCLRWNHNNQVLASSSLEGSVILTTVSGQLLYKFFPTTLQEPVNTLAFSGSSQYLGLGGTSSTVCIWDLKRKALAKSLTGHKGAINSVVFNWDDTAVASGSQSGQVLVHNVLASQHGNPLTAASLKPITCIQYSSFRKTRLAATSADGTLTIWDTLKEITYVDFPEQHKDKATGVAFSPYNHMLMCTVGMDGALVFYDMEDKKVVKVIKTGAPLTSLAFMSDGVTMAVGTHTGSVSIYDLRTGTSPRVTVQAHGMNPVTCLAFQAKSRKSSRRSSGKTAAPQQQPPAAKSASFASKDPGNPKNITVAPKAASSTGAKVSIRKMAQLNAASEAERTAPVTPLKSTSKAQTGSAGEASSSSSSSAMAGREDPSKPLTSFAGSKISLGAGPTSVAKDKPFVSPNAGHKGVEDIFSPIVKSKTGEGFSTNTKFGSVPSPSFTGNYSPYKPSGAGSSGDGGGSATATTATTTASTIAGTNITAYPSYTSTFGALGSSSSAARENTAAATTSDKPTSAYGSNSKNDRNYMATEFSSTSMSASTGQGSTASTTMKPFSGSYSPIAKKPDSYSLGTSSISAARTDFSSQQPISKKPSTSVTSQPVAASSSKIVPVEAPYMETAKSISTLLPVQTDFIKNVVEGCLDDFRYSVHRDVHNMHLELLRQFQIQKNELASVMAVNSLSPGILEELARLQRENAELRELVGQKF